MKFLLGTKQEMTSFFDETGSSVASTVIKTFPVTVIAHKTVEKNGYNAVAVGFGEEKPHKVNKAQRAQWSQFDTLFKKTAEFRVEDPSTFEIGSTLSVADLFEVGDKVTITGNSKGKGFQGVVKRHGFSGGPRSHGQKHTERAPGSIGSTGPAKVFKGTRMAGRMGNNRTAVKNLKVLHVDADDQVLLVKGAVPGRRGTLLELVSNK